jgi:hypothetical protein
MPLSAQLEALTVPFGTEFPPTVQAFLELIAEYEQITGLEDFNGINFGATEPGADDRDKPWFKTDGSGNPIGWFSWNGAAWTTIPVTASSGTTAERPSNPISGQFYLDTDINVLLIYERSQWRTASGSPGDVKEVKASDINEALTNNPGWSHDTDSEGMFIVGVSDGSGFGYNDTGGEAEHTLTESEMPAHTHTGLRSNKLQADGNAANPSGIVSGVTESGITGSTGSGEPHNNLPPYRAYWRLVKD